MADNVIITEGSGKTVAADDVGGVLYQRVKLAAGADGSATDVSDAAPLPIDDAGGSLTVDGTVAVTGALTDTELRAAPVPVSADALPLPAGAATDLGLATIAGHVDGVETALGTLLTDTELRASPVPVSGTVTASGPLTDTQLRASAVPVSLAALPALAAGTAAIGKLGANSGVDIGDVDVASMPDADIAIATITTTAAAHATSGDNTVIAAPSAGNRLVVKAIVVQNESATATTILLKSGANTKRRALLQNQGDGVAWVFPRGDEWRLGTAEALVLNLSGANSHGVTVDYNTEAV